MCVKKVNLNDMPGYMITYLYNDYCKMMFNVGEEELSNVTYLNNYL